MGGASKCTLHHRRCIMFLSQYFSLPCQYHSTNAPYSFNHLPPTLYNILLPVLQLPLSVSFQQCSIHIHSSTTHAVRFSPSISLFPCQYHFTNAPYSFIHLPLTLYNVFLPVLQYPLSVSFHQCCIFHHLHGARGRSLLTVEIQCMPFRNSGSCGKTSTCS